MTPFQRIQLFSFFTATDYKDVIRQFMMDKSDRSGSKFVVGNEIVLPGERGFAVFTETTFELIGAYAAIELPEQTRSDIHRVLLQGLPMMFVIEFAEAEIRGTKGTFESNWQKLRKTVMESVELFEKMAA